MSAQFRSLRRWHSGRSRCAQVTSAELSIESLEHRPLLATGAMSWPLPVPAPVPLQACSSDSNALRSSLSLPDLARDAAGTPAVYYISPTGSDGADGRTPLTAWRTLDRVSSRTPVPGDTYLFEGGFTFDGRLELHCVGDPANPMTFGSYGTGRATIASGIASALWYQGPGGLHIRDLIFAGAGADTNDESGIHVAGYSGLAQNFVFDNLEISGYGLAGLLVQPHDSPIQELRIIGADFHHNANGMIVGHGDPTVRLLRDVYVGYSQFHHNRRSRPDLISGIGADVMNVFGGIVERSSFYENGANSPAPGHNGLMVEYSNDLVIRHNEAYLNYDTGWGDGQGIVANGLIDSVVEHNYTHNNDSAGIQVIGEYADSHNLTVRYNISENDVSGITLGWVHVWGLTVHNNTVYHFQAEGEYRACITIFVWAGSAAFYNNVFVAEQGGVHIQITPDSLDEGKSLLFAGNLYYAPSSEHPFYVHWGEESFTSLAEWRSATGQEVLDDGATGSEADPLLIAPGTVGTVGDPDLLEAIIGYQAHPASPTATAGVDLHALGIDRGSRDFFGNLLNPGPSLSVGAHQMLTIPDSRLSVGANQLPTILDAFVVADIERRRGR